MQPKDLAQEVHKLLRENTGRWPEIAKHTEVSYSWICNIGNNRFDDAGYYRLKRVYEYLTQSQAA